MSRMCIHISTHICVYNIYIYIYIDNINHNDTTNNQTYTDTNDTNDNPYTNYNNHKIKTERRELEATAPKDVAVSLPNNCIHIQL